MRIGYKLLTAVIAVFVLFASCGFQYWESVGATFDDSRSLDVYRSGSLQGTLVLFVEQIGSTLRLHSRVDNYRGSGLPQLSCEVKTPDGILHQRTACDEDLLYNGTNGILTIYAQMDNQQLTFKYDTSTERFTAAYEGSESTSNTSPSTSSNCTTSTNACTLDLALDDDTPALNQSLDLTLRYTSSSTAYYYGQVRFLVYKQNAFGNYVTASNYSDYTIVNDRYAFTSTDVGYKVLYDHIFFRTSGTYKLRIEDDYGRFDEVTVYVGNSGCGSSCPSANTANNLLLETSDTTPDLNQYVSTYITARDGSSRAYNYYGTVNFVVEKKDGLYWYNASSSDYALSPSSSYFASNDQGYKSLSSHVVFYRSGSYRLKAVSADNSNVYGYAYYDTTTTPSYSQNKRFDLTTNDDTPGRNNFASLSLLARDSYGNRWSNYSSRVRFQVYRRAYTSDSWTEITSPNADNAIYRIYDTSYQFYSSNNGEYYNANFIKFYDDTYDYKIRVVDDYDSSMYGELYFYLRNTNQSNNNNGSNNSYTSAYRMVASFDPSAPKINSSADLLLYVRDSSNRTVSNYTNRVNFVVEKRSSPSSSSRTEASDSYCELDRSSYTFSSSDNGYVKLRDLIECKKKGRYRLKIVDDTNSNIYGYIYLTMYSSTDFDSSVRGYTLSQLRTIRTQYTSFMSNVNAWEMNNPGLAYDSERKDAWMDLYDQLYEIVYDKSGKDLSKYSEYVDAIEEFNDDFNRLR